ncbi:unnamed protein product [Heterobilharzia americana]|nr:unnamed protein product [Heterobilharzia americana]
MFTQLWMSPRIQHRCKTEAYMRVLNNAYKWLSIDILVGLSILIEFYIQPFFRLFSLPVQWIYTYEKLVLSLLSLLVACVLYHVFVIINSILYQKMKVDSDYLFDKNELLSRYPSSPLNKSLIGPSMFCSHLLKNTSDIISSAAATFGSSFEISTNASSIRPLSSSPSSSPATDVSIPQSIGDNQSIWKQSGIITVSSQHNPSASSSLSHSQCTSLLTPGSRGGQENLSLLDLALSPISNCAILPSLGSGSGGGGNHAPLHNSKDVYRSVTWSSSFLTSNSSPRYQYESAYIPLTNPCQQFLNDSLKSSSGPSFISSSITPDSGKSDRELNERFEDEYWMEHQVSKNDLDRWTLNLRKWLHGTIIRRIVNEIDTINRNLEEACGDKPLIGCEFNLILFFFL